VQNPIFNVNCKTFIIWIIKSLNTKCGRLQLFELQSFGMEGEGDCSLLEINARVCDTHTLCVYFEMRPPIDTHWYRTHAAAGACITSQRVVKNLLDTDDDTHTALQRWYRRERRTRQGTTTNNTSPSIQSYALNWSI